MAYQDLLFLDAAELLERMEDCAEERPHNEAWERLVELEKLQGAY